MFFYRRTPAVLDSVFSFFFRKDKFTNIYPTAFFGHDNEFSVRYCCPLLSVMAIFRSLHPYETDDD